MGNGTKTPIILEKLPNDEVKKTVEIPGKKERQVLGTLIECATPECKNEFVKTGNRHEFCDECQEKKHGPGYKKRVRNRNKRKYRQGEVAICAKKGCANTFIPINKRNINCPDCGLKKSIADKKWADKKWNEKIKNKKTTDGKLKKCKTYGSKNKFVPSNNIHQYCDECSIKKYGPAYLKRDLKDNSGVQKREYVKRKSLIYTTVYERELNGRLNDEAKELLLDFIETLNNAKIANFELIEINYPKARIEVREIK